MPILGTCAGMIVLAREVEGGEALFGLMDISVRRNAYGRQVESFEADLDVRGIDHRVRGVFIRAPWIERIGDRVEVLAEFEDRPVVLEFKTDQEVPPIPPHIKKMLGKKAAKAMVKGDPEETGVIVEGAKQKLHEFTESVRTALPGHSD